ncbi:IS200/IS605 family transposase, partial [Streptococcus salivarius]
MFKPIVKRKELRLWRKKLTVYHIQNG